MYRQKNTDKHPAYPCFFITFAPFNPCSKNVHFVLIFGTFRFADYILAEKFDISGEFLEEIYEMLDFVEDKSVLHLFPIEEMDKEEGGGVNLEVYNFNNDDTAVGVEAHLWDDQEYFAIIKGYYNLSDQFPKFVFHYFSC